LADLLRAQGKAVFGPGKDAAQLEGSKAFMKEILAASNVPTADFAVFTESAPALEYLARRPGPTSIKTDGLAAGKGVLVTDSFEEAERDIIDKIENRIFGDAGTRLIVIEEALAGYECSLLLSVTGQRVVALVPAQDFKRVGDGGVGPNTGGMGAFAPVDSVDRALVATVQTRLVEPLVREMHRRQLEYRGVSSPASW
jgi:phosphoribosylamine--glycine ligase